MAVAPRLDIPFAKMSIIDMVAAAELQGWRHRMWTPTSRAALPPAIEVTSRTLRMWYTHGLHVRKSEEIAGRLDPEKLDNDGLGNALKQVIKKA